MKKPGIRARTALLCGAMVAAVALLALSVNLMAERALLLRHYRNTLEVASELARDDIHYESGKLQIDRHLDNPSRVRVSVYNDNETLIYGRIIVNAPFVDGLFQRFPGRDGEDWYVYDTRLDTGENGSLWLRTCISSDTLTGLQNGQSLLLRLMVPVLAGLAGLCGWFLARRILKPVEAMTATATSIADGNDLARRIPLDGPEDELWRMGSVYNDMLARLEQSFERERRFSADAAHELRTPVAAILNQAELALSDEISEGDRLAALEVIRQRAGGMNTLINTLLQLARMESGQTTPARDMVSLDEMCQLVIESFEETAGEKGITLSVHAEPVNVPGDQLMLTQAVMNLLDNAIRYGKEGGHARVSLESDKTTARITVTDYGPGMTPEQMAHCFDRFWQADTARQKGTGLGLSLVSRIARLHGGEATVAGVPGGGCAFTLSLPLDDRKGANEACE